MLGCNKPHERRWYSVTAPKLTQPDQSQNSFKITKRRAVRSKTAKIWANKSHPLISSTSSTRTFKLKTKTTDNNLTKWLKAQKNLTITDALPDLTIIFLPLTMNMSLDPEARVLHPIS